MAHIRNLGTCAYRKFNATKSFGGKGKIIREIISSDIAEISLQFLYHRCHQTFGRIRKIRVLREPVARPLFLAQGVIACSISAPTQKAIMPCAKNRGLATRDYYVVLRGQTLFAQALIVCKSYKHRELRRLRSYEYPTFHFFNTSTDLVFNNVLVLDRSKPWMEKTH